MFDFVLAKANGSETMIASTLENLIGVGGVIGFLFLLVCLVFSVAAIIMPIVVLLIHQRTAEIARTLAAMEWMMRNGK